MTDDQSNESGNAVENTTLEGPSRRAVLKGGAAASTLLGLGIGGAGAVGAQESPTETETETDDETETAEITFRNQTSNGTSVTVESVTLPDGGYVIIHDTGVLEGAFVPTVVGVSDYLEPGTSEGVEVDLFNVAESTSTLTELDGTQALVAMPHRDTTDDETFDFVTSGGVDDGPYLDAGQPIVDAAYAVVDAVPTEVEIATETETETANETANETATETETETPEDTGTP